jgi:hypothetical protein
MKVVPKSPGQTGQRILIPASAPVTQLRTGNVATLSASALNPISSATILPSGANSYVMLPAQYVQQVRIVNIIFHTFQGRGSTGVLIILALFIAQI